MSEKTAAPAPFKRVYPKDVPGYLIAAGWAPMGDPQKYETMWLDPTRPDEDAEEYRVTGVRKIVTQQYPEGRDQEVRQLVVTPRAFPMTRHEALETQMKRDRAK